MSSNPQKLKKKQLFTRKMILDLFQKIKDLTFHNIKVSIRVLLDFSKLGVVLNLILVSSIKRKIVSEDCPKYPENVPILILK